jgi:hypothetical protein
MKLELKHLAPYLPYNVYVGDGRTPFKLTEHNFTNVFKYLTTIYLHPLSDYEKFEQIVAEMTCYEMGMIDENANHSKMISYLTVELMFKYHIDVFNLIPQGLAIDINTLNKEL